VGLIGPNGAGKTTLFNVISGMLRPNTGVVKFKGENITNLKPHLICKKGIARTFQIPKVFEGMTVLDNVVIGALSREKSIERARSAAIETLEFVGLSPQMNHPAGSLTAADRKRLELARALATKPELLLLDEVMAGLNPSELDEMLALIKKIREEGKTLFIVEHVMRAVMSICNRIIVLHHGEVIATGRPREVANDQRVIDVYLGEKIL
jgi:branched-chain amino acid transport system ATP-binding protein